MSRASTTRSLTALLTLVGMLAASEGAAAQDVGACGERRLDGAADAAGHPEVTFVEAWRPALAELRACLDDAPPDACLEVQGQFDDRSFPPAIEHSLGSAEAAQLQRAHARAEAVVTELIELGAPYDRVREHPPTREASYRGVRVRLVRSCVASSAPARTEPTQSDVPAWLASPDTAARDLLAAEERLRAGDAPPPAPRRGPWSIDGALGFAYQLSGGTDAFSFAPRLGVGFATSDLYARVFVAVGAADELEQRAFLEWGLSFGGFVAPWCTLGATFTHRLGTFRVGDPLYEQSYFLGATSEQRVLDLGVVSFWVHETLSPLGLRDRRGGVVNGAPVNIPDRLDYAARFEVLLVVRGHLDSDPQPAH